MRTVVNWGKMEAHKWKETPGWRVRLYFKVEGWVDR